MPAQLYPRRDFPCGHAQSHVCNRCAGWHLKRRMRDAVFLPHLGGAFRSLVQHRPAPRIRRAPASIILRNSR